jgi:hypothetical protein
MQHGQTDVALYIIPVTENRLEYTLSLRVDIIVLSRKQPLDTELSTPLL